MKPSRRGRSGNYRSTGRPIISRRVPPKKRIQGDGGSRKKLAAARRKLSRRAVPVWRKGRCHKGPTVEKRRRKGPECNNGIKDRCARQQLRLRNGRTSNKTFRQAAELDAVKQIVGTSIRLRKMSIRTLWGSRPPPTRKKRQLAA
jgi:hypothetical protein